ncbi:IS30 family transposase, partial [Streptococcus anginosus]
PKGSSLKKLNPTLLEDYTKAINERPRRIHDYQSAKKLFELTQTA